MVTGENYNIYVTHVEVTESDSHQNSPICFNFWGQKERIAIVYLENCLDSLKDHFETSLPPSNVESLSEQVICVFIDNVWIRAKLANPSNICAAAFVKVFCIDYGKVQMVSPEQIRTLPPFITHEVQYLKEYPPFASQFVLADISITRSLEATEYLRKNFINQLWSARTVRVHSDGREEVELFSRSNALLSTTLTEAGIGTIPSLFQSSLIPDQKEGASTSFANSPGYRTKLWTPSKPETVSKPDSVPLINSRLYTASALSNIGYQDVIVTNVVNGINKFVVQPKEAKGRLADLRLMLDSIDLVPMIEVCYSKPCIAICPHDKLFHRGLITSVMNSTVCQVYFIDYGNTEILENCFVFEIPDELMKIKLQVIALLN